MDDACYSYIGTCSDYTESTGTQTELSYFESTDFFKKPASTYFIATDDGRLSPEFLGPPMDILGCSTMVISTVYSNDIEFSSSKMSQFLDYAECGVEICIFIPERQPHMKENLWLIRRGLTNIYGDILLTSRTCGSHEIFTSTQDAIEITEKSLAKRDYCILDSIHKLNVQNNQNEDLGSGSGCIPYLNKNKNKNKSPCMLCGKCKVIGKEVKCSCKRKHYCSIKCQELDKDHKESEIHRGIFL